MSVRVKVMFLCSECARKVRQRFKVERITRILYDVCDGCGGLGKGRNYFVIKTESLAMSKMCPYEPDTKCPFMPPYPCLNCMRRVLSKW